MPMVFACPSCDRKLKTPDDAEGRRIRCPACSSTLVVTEAGLSLAETAPRRAAAAPAAAPRAARRPRPDEDEPPRRARRRDEEDDYADERPARRRLRARVRGIPLWVWLASGGVTVAALVVILILVLGGGGGFGKIKDGMSEKEVVDILGKPNAERKFGDTKTLHWEKGDDLIVVVFKDDKVKEKKKVSKKEIEKELGKFK